MNARSALAVPLALLLAAAAPLPQPSPQSLAQPPAHPTRDALIAYRVVPAAGEAISVGVAMRAGGKGFRMDLPDKTYILAEPAIHTILLVVPLERTVLDMPWTDGPQTLFLVDEQRQFAKKNETSIAGLRCTVWEAEEKRASLCVTGSGLILRNESRDDQGRRNLVEATLVRFQSLPPAAFAVPPGFEKLSPLPPALVP